MRQYYWLSSSKSPGKRLSSTQAPSSKSAKGTVRSKNSASVPSTAATELLSDETVEKLRRQHQLILNAVGEGVYGLDLRGNVTFVNPAAAQMIGWQPEDLIGQSMHVVLHHSRMDGSPYPRHECPIYAALKDGLVHRTNNEVFWRKDGTCFPVEYISTPMHDEQGKIIGSVVTFQDITQRKWAEAVLQKAHEDLEAKVEERTAELRQANEQLKELSELKSRFVSMVCHEFRNPLNNILLSASSLKRYENQLSEQQKTDYLQGIQLDVERMAEMIDDLLVIDKVEAKKIEVHPTDIDLVWFCQALVAELHQFVGTHPILFDCPDTQLMVQADEKLLRSILMNILTNAIRYSPSGSEIYFQLQYQHQEATFHIRDQGIGIPEDDQHHLFDPFHRGANVSNIPGTGLGLSIVKKFVDLQQGTINVRSRIGFGTTFVITLPLPRITLH